MTGWQKLYPWAKIEMPLSKNKCLCTFLHEIIIAAKSFPDLLTRGWSVHQNRNYFAAKVFFCKLQSDRDKVGAVLCCAELYVVENAPLRHKKSPFATSSPPLALFWAMPNLNLIPLSFNAHRLSFNTLLCLSYSRLYILAFHIF